MVIFGNKSKAVVVFLGLVCVLYGFTAVRSRGARFSGGGTTGWDPETGVTTTGGGSLQRGGGGAWDPSMGATYSN